MTAAEQADTVEHVVEQADVADQADVAEQADVVIVGGGPVGLMLACELRLSDVPVVLLERLPAPTGESRALGLHSRTVEVLDQRGLLAAVDDKVPVWPKGHFAGMRKVDMTKLDAEHSYALMVPQSRTEQILLDRALELGANVRRGHHLVSLESPRTEDLDTADAVEFEAEDPDGRRYRLRSRFLVGCDGGSSTVRKLAGIPFPGTASTVNAVLGDVRLLGEQPKVRELLRVRGGQLGIIPLGEGLFRVIAVEFDTDPVPRDVPVTPQEIADTVRRVSDLELKVGEARWMSRFGNATRLVDNYRRGPILLAGDAAHVHFPAGGQGLNTGVQDALNLGWKLAGVLRGWAPETLLDTYESERRPVAKRVCMNTRAQLALMHPADEITPLRDLFSELMDLEQVNRYLGEMIAGLDIRYPMTARSETEPPKAPALPNADDAPTPVHDLVGRRMRPLHLTTNKGPTTVTALLREGRGILLDLTADASDNTSHNTDLAALAKPRTDRLTYVPAALADDEKYPAPELVLVRPDGYVAWTGTAATADTDGLPEALDTWFGTVPTTS